MALLGESKVGLLFDLGEGGLSIRGVIPETEAEFHFVSFGLPGTDRFVNARAEIAWSSRSEQRTGLRFVQMATTSRQKLREWLVFEARLEKTNAKSDVKAVREQCEMCIRDRA